MNALITAGAAPQTMTSREIADLVESRHADVCRTIERLMKDCAISGYAPTAYTHPQNGQTYTEYHIGQRDSYVIVAQLSPQFTARLVDRWQELEAGAALKAPQTFAQALRLAAEQAELIEQQQAALTAAAPKIEFADAVRNVDGLCSLEKIAKTLGWGRNKFIKALKVGEVLQDSRIPYQKYIDRGYFEVVEQTPYTDSKGVTHPTFTTMVTGKGQVWLAKKFSDQGAA